MQTMALTKQPNCYLADCAPQQTATLHHRGTNKKRPRITGLGRAQWISEQGKQCRALGVWWGEGRSTEASGHEASGTKMLVQETGAAALERQRGAEASSMKQVCLPFTFLGRIASWGCLQWGRKNSQEWRLKPTAWEEAGGAVAAVCAQGTVIQPSLCFFSCGHQARAVGRREQGGDGTAGGRAAMEISAAVTKDTVTQSREGAYHAAKTNRGLQPINNPLRNKELSQFILLGSSSVSAYFWPLLCLMVETVPCWHEAGAYSSFLTAGAKAIAACSVQPGEPCGCQYQQKVCPALLAPVVDLSTGCVNWKGKKQETK